MRIRTALHRLALFLALGMLWAAFPGAVAGAMAQEVRNPDGVAVIIGNRDYAHRDVPEVTFAHRDADAFRRYVIEVLGYAPENIIDLRDARRGQLFDALGSLTDPHGLLWSYLNPDGGSDVVVFYSGHGVPGLNDGRGYLLPSDTDPKEAEHDGYPIDLLYKNVGGLAEAETVQVYLDACFSGGSAGGAVIKDASPVYLTPKLPEGVGEKVVSLTAASGKQIASWDREKEQGLFTHHLLDALYGGGDADGDGHVTASETKAYLDKYMTRAARRQHRRVQEASLLGSEGVVLAAALVDGVFPTRGDADDLASIPIVEGPGDEFSPFAAALDLVTVTGGDAILVVETAPPGASVVVSGARVGETPFSEYDLRAGTYTVKLDHPTHETVVMEDQVLVDHQVLRIEQTLNPATGKVTVITRPSGGWVEHDGERVADSTPVTLEKVPSGSMVLTLGAAGHRPIEVEVQVPKGDVAVVNRELEEIKYGTLTLVLEPADARVTLTDGDAGYQAGMRLVDGEHRVRVTREGYQEVSRAVTVSGDTRARIVLEPVKPQEVDTVLEPSAPTPETEKELLGLSRDELRRIQRNLISLGHYAGSVDGLFGKDTREAIRKWQSSQKMAATGYLDVDSAKALLAVQPETSITVHTVPPNAKVRVFTASGSEYRDGMLVKPGEYMVAVDAPDHEAFRRRLAVEGPTTFKIALCKLKEKVETTCSDRPVKRTKKTQEYHNRRIEKRATQSIPSRLLQITASESINREKGIKLERLCQTIEQRVKESVSRTCVTLGGRIDRSSFRIVRTDCDRFNQRKLATIVGSMECTNIPEVVEQTYVAMEKECRNTVEEVRNCPDEIVTKLH